MQTIISENGTARESEIQSLYRLRYTYYTELLRDIDMYKIRIKEKIISYGNTVKDIDDKITRLEHEKKNKSIYDNTSAKKHERNIKKIK
jgi:hypothetical protein